jgi:hypothetical protein
VSGGLIAGVVQNLQNQSIKYSTDANLMTPDLSRSGIHTYIFRLCQRGIVLFSVDPTDRVLIRPAELIA